MLLLALETSGIRGSVALAHRDTNQPAESWLVKWDKKATHSEVATTSVESILKKSGRQLSDLTHLAVNVGPGSFTGLRVGLNLIRTLGFCLGLPIANFNALELLIWKHAQTGDKVFVAVKAIQNFYYCAAYEKTATGLRELLSPRSVREDELMSFTSVATKVLIEGQTPGFSSELDASTLVELSTIDSNRSHFLQWSATIPLYVRGSEAEEKLRRGVQRT